MPFSQAAVSLDVLQVNTQSLPNAFTGTVTAGGVVIAQTDCSQFTTFQATISCQFGTGTTPGIGVASMDFAIDWFIPDPLNPGQFINLATDTYEIQAGINPIGSAPITISGLVKGTQYRVRCVSFNATVSGGGIATITVNLGTIPVDKTRAYYPTGNDYIGPYLASNIAASGSSGLLLAYPMMPGSDIMLRMGSDTAGGKMEFRFQWGNNPATPLRSISIDVLQANGYSFLQVPAPNRPLLVNIFNGVAAVGAYSLLCWSQSQ